MRKRVLLSVVLAALATNFNPVGQPVWARSSTSAHAPVATTLPVVSESDTDIQSVMALLKEVLEASNKHDIESVMRHYAAHYQSGDHLTLQQVKQMIQETWKLYPDIQYDSKIVSVHVAGDWATVQTLDTAHATAMPDGSLTGANKAKKGTLDSNSRGLLYLRRLGQTWEIVSDQTLYEQAIILYGDVKNLSLLLSAPDSVMADQTYSAKLKVKVPANKLVIASITKDPLVYPQQLPQEKFRSLNDDDTVLERVLQANKDSLNEMITVTVGLTEVTQDNDERPNIKLQGVATLVKRVNVTPHVAAVPSALNGSQLVRKSASGLIDLSRVEPNRPGTPKLPAPGKTVDPGSPSGLSPTPAP